MSLPVFTFSAHPKREQKISAAWCCPFSLFSIQSDSTLILEQRPKGVSLAFCQHWVGAAKRFGQSPDFESALRSVASLGCLGQREILGEMPDRHEFYCESLVAGKLKSFWKGRNSFWTVYVYVCVCVPIMKWRRGLTRWAQTVMKAKS